VPRGTRGSSRVDQGFTYGAITHYGRTFQTVQLPITNPTSRPHNPKITEVILVWASPLSLAATYGITFVFFSWGYLDVSVPPVRLMYLCIQYTILEHYLQRVSQSLFSGSPKLFAAYHVLHRLSLPRHPPYALSSLTIKKSLVRAYCYTPLHNQSTRTYMR
jgi:hypothetical protein